MSSGLFSGLSNVLFGSAPSVDYSQYLAQMRDLDSQINALYSGAPKADVVGSPQFAQIQSLLAPGAGGSLSSPLLAMYNSGALTNNMNAGAAGALTLSGIQGRNLGGSSVENQALENVGLQNTLANSGLLASLYGLQNQNTGQLAGLLSQGTEFDVAQNNALLNAQAAALGGQASMYGSLAQQGIGQNYQSQLANYQTAGQLGSSLIGSAITAGMMPPAGASPSDLSAFQASEAGTHAMNAANPLLAGSYGMPGYYTGGAGYGAGSYP